MRIQDILSPEGVLAPIRAASKKQVLQELAQRAAKITGCAERVIFETLLERERLGTTGLGQGVAIPHGKLSGLTRLHALFARLDPAVDFEAIDDQPVDLVFLLLAPEHAGADHLKALAQISRLMRNGPMVDGLRGCLDHDALYAMLTEPSLLGSSVAPHAA